MDAITLKDVTKGYDGFTLDKVSFSLPTGTIMGIIGENGAGKSTTINLIMDIVKADSGEISIFEKPVPRELGGIKEHIGFVTDSCCFHDALNAKYIDKIMKKIYKTWDSSRYNSYLKRFKLPETKKIKEYSKGMKMKLSIIVALSHDSRLLILDEVTSGLDPIIRDEILDILHDFIKDEENSVIISSHIISDLEKICDYITFIHGGRVVFSQGKDEMLDNYGILKCTLGELELVDKRDIVGVRKNAYGAEALVKRSKNMAGLVEKATIEDIMLYHIKEGIER